MDSLVGPRPALSALSGLVAPSRPAESKSGRARSLGLLDRAGFAWGDDVGDETRGGCLDC